MSTFFTPLTLPTSTLDKYRQQLNEASFAVYLKDTNTFKPIPAGTQALVIQDQAWDEVVEDCKLTLSAAEKIIRYLQKGENLSKWELMYHSLSHKEKDAAKGKLEKWNELATMRLDLFFDEDNIKILEINATIPAMQAYSDIVKKSFINAYLSDTAATSRNTPTDGLFQENTNDLLHSLLSLYGQNGGSKKTTTIAILARHGDSQLAELLWYQKKWSSIGHQVFIIEPKEISFKNDQLCYKNETIDIAYRHIFAYRIDEHLPCYKALSNNSKYHIYNPIAAHWEAKGLMSFLSQSIFDKSFADQLGLSEAELAAIEKRLVWSRLLLPGASSLPNRNKTDDFVNWVKENPQCLVAKRNTGYGGHNVFIGATIDSDVNQNKLRELLKVENKVSWAQFIDFCAHKDQDAWLIQERINGRQIDGAWITQTTLESRRVYIDCSLFASLGNQMKLKGGVCRFAPDPIVNIARGGGVMPFLLQSEAEKLIALKT